MSEMPPDPARLRVLITWLELALAEARRRLAEAEQHAADEAARPRWWVQWMRRPAGTGRHGVLHRTGCWAAGAPDMHADAVRQLAAEPDVQIEPCPVCGDGTDATMTP